MPSIPQNLTPSSAALDAARANGPATVMGWLAPVLPAAVLLALLTWLLPHPQEGQGWAFLPGRDAVQSLPYMGTALLYAYMGSALAITAMCVVVWSWLRDSLYLHCAAVVAIGMCYSAFRYRPEGFPLPGIEPSEHVLGVLYCLFCVAATTFFSRLFEFRRNWVWAARLFSLVAWFSVLALGVALAGGYGMISRAVVFVALLSTSFGALFVLYLLVVRRRWQYLPGALVFALPTALGILRLLGTHGLLPAFLILDAPMLWFVSRLSSVLLLAVAVVNRTRVAERALREERRLALARALAAERELEAKVRERTEELLHAQNALQAALHSEREMRLEQRQFFNMINHEFRTPLAVVDGVATEMQTFPPTGADAVKEQADQIRRACRRLIGLVDNCLVNDRLDANAFQLQLDWVALDELIEEPAELVQWSKRHRLRLDLAQAPDEWKCDRTLVRIALSNLVGNAIKYAQAGEIAISARGSAAGDLALSVSDEGPGLSPEAAERIFVRYERGREINQTNGYGLGLWVTRRIARLHGGDVTVSPSPQGGSCFTLTLGKSVRAGAPGEVAAALAGQPN